MQALRKKLSWVAVAWLTCQAAGLAAAPLGLCCASATAMPVPGAGAPECCTRVAPGQDCPMHHRQARPAAPTCRMCGTSQPTDAAFISLIGGQGILPPPPVLVVSTRPSGTPVGAPSSPILRSTRPESPPPRA